MALRVGPVEFVRCLAVVAAGVGFHHGRVRRKSLALDEAGCHASCNDALEDVAQDVARAEAAKPIHRERRMVRNLVVEVEGNIPAGELECRSPEFSRPFRPRP
jgi:hypothetical protein